MTLGLMTPRKFSGDLLILGCLMTSEAQNFPGLTYRHFFSNVEFQKLVDRKFENADFIVGFPSTDEIGSGVIFRFADFRSRWIENFLATYLFWVV